MQGKCYSFLKNGVVYGLFFLIFLLFLDFLWSSGGGICKSHYKWESLSFCYTSSIPNNTHDFLISLFDFVLCKDFFWVYYLFSFFRLGF